LADAICNTSPFQYLHQLGRLDLLPRLLGRVLLPPAVASELHVGRTRGVSLPDPALLDWVESRAPRMSAPALATESSLGRGETEALALAFETGGLLVLDDGEARRVAARLGLSYTGTLGVLRRARQAGLVPRLAPELDRLAALGFRFDRAVREELLREP
jgi:predicted nucleic acid-binding protein